MPLKLQANRFKKSRIRVPKHDGPEGGEICATITRTFRNGPSPTWKLVVEGDDGIEFELYATENHPFFVPEKGWTACKDLEPGDACVDRSGALVRVVSTELDPEKVPVYNIEVEGAHTYFVGKSGLSILVHNDCEVAEPELVSKRGSLFDKIWSWLGVTKPESTSDIDKMQKELMEGRLEGMAQAGRTAKASVDIAADFNPVNVALETVTGQRGSEPNETVPLWERALNVGTTHAGSAAAGAAAGFLRKGARLADKGAEAVEQAGKHADDAKALRRKNSTQNHHFATKYGDYAEEMQGIVDKYGLKIDDAWNKEMMPGHLGRHTDDYHDEVIRRMRLAADEAGNDKAKFLELYEKYVKSWVRNNPSVMYMKK